MQTRIPASLFLTGCLVVLGCGNNIKRGHAGESCASANDCGDGLACVALVCITATSNDDNNDEDAGKPDSASSCTARRDCPEGSACLNNTCMAMSLGMSAQARYGGHGESCQATNDCEPDLACISGTCREAGLPLSHLAKSCYRVECATSDDCCATFTPNPNCDTYKANCQTDPVFCNTYRSLCECSKSCEDEVCVAAQPGCKSDPECTSAQTPFCVDGTCRQCNDDSACPGENSKCASGVCMSPCSGDANCPLLYDCVDSACKRTGCKSDRECAFITKNPRAICKDSNCQSPCSVDGDCASMEANDTNFKVCVDGECKFVGCQTDRECRAALGIAAEQGKVHAVCR